MFAPTRPAVATQSALPALPVLTALPALPVLLGLLALLAFSAFAWPATALAQTGSQPVTISFLVTSHEPYLSNVDVAAAVRRFEAQNPDIRVQLIYGGGSADYIEGAMTAIAAGVEFDVVTANPHWGLGLAVDTLTRDLTPFMQRDGVGAGDFVPGSLTGYAFGRKTWGLPLLLGLRGAAYNQRLLDEAGYDPPADHEWTWTDVETVARRLTIDRTGDREPDQFGVDMGGRPRVALLHPLAYQAGGMFFDSFTNPRRSLWNSEEAYTAIQYYLNFFLNAYTPMRQDDFRFYMGRSAFTMDAVPLSRARVDRDLGHVDIRFIPAPAGPVRGGFQQSAHGIGMAATTRQPEAAWRFIRYMATDMGEIEARYAADRVEAMMAAYLPAVPLYFDLAEVVVDLDSWILVATHPDNTSPYLPMAPAEPIIEPVLERVVRGQLALEHAIEDIHHQLQVMLDDNYVPAP